MKLILSHSDLELALINDLRAKGMTAFEPGKATVEFSFKRGTKELICELDTEGKPAAPAAEPVVAGPAAGGAQVDAETPDTQNEAQTATPVAVEQAAETAQPLQEQPAAEPVPADDGDNLFQ